MENERKILEMEQTNEVKGMECKGVCGQLWRKPALYFYATVSESRTECPLDSLNLLRLQLIKIRRIS